MFHKEVNEIINTIFILHEQKNRKSIPCYWETQAGGCRKPHCSFKHKNARTITSNPINPVKNPELTSKSLLNQERFTRLGRHILLYF